MNKNQLTEKYKIEFSGKLIVCQPLDNTAVSRLQIKMLNKTGINAALPCSVIRWDDTEKMVYLIKGNISVKEQIRGFSKNTCIQMLRKLLELLVWIEKSGYMYVRNVVLDREFLFYDSVNQKLEVIYLPEEIKEGEESFDSSPETAKALTALMENTSLSEVFEWKQCELHFNKRCASAAAMYSYFKDSFPTDGSAKEISDGRRIGEVVLRGNGNGVELHLPVGSGECVIGRGNVYALNQFPVISSRHCKLYADNKGAFVVDLKSTNGTFLNGRRLESAIPYALHENVEISLAGIKFTVFLEWEN